MGWKSSDVVKFDLEPLFKGQTWIAKLKSAFNPFMFDRTGLQSETNL